ncbi:MAG: DegQ family serine endoprotease [Deltaproteobacteria bacterium]|nr:DegQ family serine endoprotease [Deltaproteobacteria bacterium]
MADKKITWKTIIFTLIFALTCSTLLPTAGRAQEQGLESLRQTGQAFRSVAKKVSPAVVFIKVVKEVSGAEAGEFFSPFGNPFDDEFFQRFFGQPHHFKTPKKSPRKRQTVGQGSGFLITSDGYIMTNNHVVGNADKVQVKLQDGREYTAEIIGTDPPTDLAVIKIDEKDLPFLRLGDSKNLEVGDWVLAIGNPFGLSHTLTAGIVSAKGRSGMGLSDYEDFIQTDAAINPGNSGGPLVNLDGEVVGINSAIVSRSGGYMGIGFAIPINLAKHIRGQLVEQGQVTRGQIGAYIQQMTPDLAKAFNLDEARGIIVTQVMEDSPAEKAGLKQGDVILEMDGKTVEKVATFRNRVALTPPGTKVELTIVRNGKTKDIYVVIGKLETNEQGQPTTSGDLPKLGLSLQALTPELAERFGYEGRTGVLVANVDTGSLAQRLGIRQGDLIEEIDRQVVSTPEQARKLLQSKEETHLLLIRHGEGSRYLTLKFDD